MCCRESGVALRSYYEPWEKQAPGETPVASSRLQSPSLARHERAIGRLPHQNHAIEKRADAVPVLNTMSPLNR